MQEDGREGRLVATLPRIICVAAYFSVLRLRALLQASVLNTYGAAYIWVFTLELRVSNSVISVGAGGNIKSPCVPLQASFIGSTTPMIMFCYWRLPAYQISSKLRSFRHDLNAPTTALSNSITIAANAEGMMDPGSSWTRLLLARVS